MPLLYSSGGPNQREADPYPGTGPARVGLQWPRGTLVPCLPAGMAIVHRTWSVMPSSRAGVVVVVVGGSRTSQQRCENPGAIVPLEYS